MPILINPTEAAKDAITPTTKQSGNDIVAGTTTRASEVQEVTSTSVISIWKTQAGASSVLMQGLTVSATQKAWPWQFGPPGWTPGANPWSQPTTVITLASTVTYTQQPLTVDVSQSSAPASTTSEIRTNGMGISGAAAAGIGIGASIGLFGLGIGVLYICNKFSHRRKRQRSQGLILESQDSDEQKANDDALWPPYPYSASNEFPVELSTIRQPEEMCAKSKPQEKDASSCSEIAELDCGWR
ncbi:hypothetical protein HD806DRAFT_80094 [Xylariaceae sp. AK1471]|nr:hypothetical protein HD806DRAFT_80094 [Xylariaceae sp. AK1471]